MRESGGWGFGVTHSEKPCHLGAKGVGRGRLLIHSGHRHVLWPPGFVPRTNPAPWCPAAGSMQARPTGNGRGEGGHSWPVCAPKNIIDSLLPRESCRHISQQLHLITCSTKGTSLPCGHAPLCCTRSESRVCSAAQRNRAAANPPTPQALGILVHCLAPGTRSLGRAWCGPWGAQLTGTQQAAKSPALAAPLPAGAPTRPAASLPGPRLPENPPGSFVEVLHEDTGWESATQTRSRWPSWRGGVLLPVLLVSPPVAAVLVTAQPPGGRTASRASRTQGALTRMPCADGWAAGRLGPLRCMQGGPGRPGAVKGRPCCLLHLLPGGK